MTIKAPLVSLQGFTVNSIDRKRRHKHTDRHRVKDIQPSSATQCCCLTCSHGHRDGASSSFSPHMGYDPAGPLGLPPCVPQQAVHLSSVSPTQHDTKLQSAASALTVRAHVFLRSWSQAARKREGGKGYKWRGGEKAVEEKGVEVSGRYFYGQF